MNSRDRVIRSINHMESDRIPIDLGSIRNSGISAVAYNRLKKRLNFNGNIPRMYDFIQQIVYPEKEIRDLFNIDLIDAGQAFLNSDNEWKEWISDDGEKCLIPKYLNVEIDENSNISLKNDAGTVIGIKPRTSLYIDQLNHVYQEKKAIPEIFHEDEFRDYLWLTPTPPWHLNVFDEKELKIFVENIKRLHSDTNYAIVLTCLFNIFERALAMRGTEEFFTDLYFDKKGAERLLDRFIEDYLKILERVLKEAGNYIDVIKFGDDFGSQSGPMISPDMFKEIFKPRYKVIWDLVHDKSNCKILLHSCGSVYKIIPIFIDMGLDALNPIHTNASDMDSKKIKKEFGKDITFWGGGVDTQKILPFGTPGEVKEDVKKRLEIFSKGGGYIFAPIHNILNDVPPGNIIAMYEAVKEFGGY